MTSKKIEAIHEICRVEWPLALMAVRLPLKAVCWEASGFRCEDGWPREEKRIELHGPGVQFSRALPMLLGRILSLAHQDYNIKQSESKY